MRACGVACACSPLAAYEYQRVSACRRHIAALNNCQFGGRSPATDPWCCKMFPSCNAARVWECRVITTEMVPLNSGLGSQHAGVVEKADNDRDLSSPLIQFQNSRLIVKVQRLSTLANLSRKQGNVRDICPRSWTYLSYSTVFYLNDHHRFSSRRRCPRFFALTLSTMHSL